MQTLTLLLRTLSLCAAAICSIGCSSSSKGTAPGLVILVPGVAGDGSWYRHVTPSLRAAGDQRTVESFRWGAPGPAFFLNFNSVSIHESAERKLAERIVAYRKTHPHEPIDLITHSAGGGVALGALAKLPEGVRVGRLILLHPSVSPTYPLEGPLKACDAITLFYSDRDKTFLQWRTSTFGTYDNIKTNAAGNAGFDPRALSTLNASAASQVTMHAYQQDDRALGNNGDHFGALAKEFLRQRVIPILTTAIETNTETAAVH